jgi:membrane-bound lytic murein transglycosylase D
LHDQFEPKDAMRKIFFLALIVGLAGIGPAALAAPSSNTSFLPALLRTVKPPPFCNEPVPLKVPGMRERFEKELMLMVFNQPQVILWLKRGHRHFPEIEKILARHGVPLEFKYMAVVESALRPHARSGKKAVGFWQMLSQTGRKYGLRVDRHVDQRRNLTASTNAAARYLLELKEMFGSWTLAAAAYNMGEKGLMAEILAQKANDFYRLYLPMETQRFVFRILVVKAIFKNPERFGFVLQKNDYYVAPQVALTQVDCKKEIPIRLVAQAASTDFIRIKELNPELRGHYLVAGKYDIKIPVTGAKGFAKRFNALALAHGKNIENRIYIVQKGDNLSLIAEHFKVPLAALIIWNRIDLRRPIQPGTRLIVRPEGTIK